MRYRIHPGIALRRLGGCCFLAADRVGHRDCPRVQELNEYAAFCWTLLEKGLDMEEMKEAVAVHYEIPQEEAAEGLLPFLEQLTVLHYIET